MGSWLRAFSLFILVGMVTQSVRPNVRIERQIRGAIDEASNGQVGPLVERLASFDQQLKDVQSRYPRSMWPRVTAEARNTFLANLDSYPSVNVLLQATAFPFEVADVETRLDVDRRVEGSIAATFVTLRYLSSNAAPLSGTSVEAGIVRQALLEFRTDQQTGKIERISAREIEIFPPSDVPYRVTGIAWVYYSRWRLRMTVIGATWPISVGVGCGRLGEFSLANAQPEYHWGAARGIYMDMESLRNGEGAGTCLLAVRDVAGKEERLKFQVSTPVRDYQCWPREVYAKTLLAVMQGCNVVSSYLESQ